MQKLDLILAVSLICFAISATKAEDENSILLRYQATGYVLDRNRTVEWNREFEDPNSLTSVGFRSNVASQILQIADKVYSVVGQNLTIVFWNNSNSVGVDYSYYFRTPNWRDSDDWNKRFIKAYNESAKPYFEERFRLIQPVYLSYVRENILIPGGAGTPYKTSSELTYELVLDDAELWFEGLLDTENRNRRFLLWQILDDIYDVYGPGDSLRNINHKFLFWLFNGEVRVSVTLLIPFNVDSRFNKLNDPERFTKEFAEKYQYLRDRLKFEQKLTKVIAIRTPPIQYPNRKPTTKLTQ